MRVGTVHNQVVAAVGVPLTSRPLSLVVPEVEPGDVGLVLRVTDVEWHGPRREWRVCTGGPAYYYALPAELHGWARTLHYEVHRQKVRLPQVYAFSVQGGVMAARMLSTV